MDTPQKHNFLVPLYFSPRFSEFHFTRLLESFVFCESPCVSFNFNFHFSTVYERFASFNRYLKILETDIRAQARLTFALLFTSVLEL